MATPMTLPAGYAERPLALTDAATVTREMAANELATRKDQRNRGLAQALLADAFGAARAHGATRATLSTDSRTGALDLYLRVGMKVESTWVHRATRP